MLKHKPSPATLIASVALFFSLAGAGMAASGYRITSIWQIAPKVRNALRGERGPQGAQGFVGAPGPQGPSGPQGPAGAVRSVVFGTVTGATTTVLPGDTTTTVASCPAFTTLTGGGYRASDGLTISESRPFDGGSLPIVSGQWIVVAANHTQAPLIVQPWVVCANSASS